MIVLVLESRRRGCGFPGRRLHCALHKGFSRMLQRVGFALVMALILGGPLAARADTNEDTGAPNPWIMCAKATTRIERRERIPRQLLRAISKAESGRYHVGKQLVMAWPWTVMAEGRGRYLDTKEAAIAEVEGLRARGVKNIDVGFMQ